MYSTHRLVACCVLLALLLLLLAAVARPAAPSPRRATRSSAIRSPIYDEQLNEVATITVTEYADPFEEYDQELASPDRGYKIVAVQVEVEVTGESAVDVSDFDIVLQDDSGFLWGSAYVPLPEDGDLAAFEGDNLAPGDTAAGVIAYQIPDDATALRVFYAPSSPSRLYLLADLQDAATGTDDAEDDAEDTEDDAEDGRRRRHGRRTPRTTSPPQSPNPLISHTSRHVQHVASAVDLPPQGS